MWIAMAIILTPSPRPRSHTQLPLPTGPNTAMFLGQSVGQWGGRDGSLEEELGWGWGWGAKRGRDGEVAGLQESPRQRVQVPQREQRMALTTGGMSFPLISCNRNGVIRGGAGGGGAVADHDENTRRFPVQWTCDTSDALVTLSGYNTRHGRSYVTLQVSPEG